MKQYPLEEASLENSTSSLPNPLPKHIGIIMDGNRRWAKANGKPPQYGHLKGIDVVDTVIRASQTLGIRTLTLYAFSTENWTRSPSEISYLMSLFKKYLDLKCGLLVKNQIQLKVIGERKRLPRTLQLAIHQVEEMTKRGNSLRLNLAISYGGQQELLQACKELLDEKGDFDSISTKDLQNALQAPEVDLLIRTGGEHRLSNFLLFQLAYAELYFTETHWPDFTHQEFLKAIESYFKRKRRFGS